eukprot:CAMPEP_0113921830 /NCGR_PEP_ID=MMETSP1159-20121227/1292_1 /TAXON_ID=88271 /ORGANISM="Picocystis salinarum" /LENGTH=203 /DNA_ID=CAMNT_0000921905 /DNA_START=472 /DNA_END=1080 /DNA_ORIENTATION=- /assembly_acc=CAM_ASM_000767
MNLEAFELSRSEDWFRFVVVVQIFVLSHFQGCAVPLRMIPTHDVVVSYIAHYLQFLIVGEHDPRHVHCIYRVEGILQFLCDCLAGVSPGRQELVYVQGSDPLAIFHVMTFADFVEWVPLCSCGVFGEIHGNHMDVGVMVHQWSPGIGVVDDDDLFDTFPSVVLYEALQQLMLVSHSREGTQEGLLPHLGSFVRRRNHFLSMCN